jgi:hypothetical protein
MPSWDYLDDIPLVPVRVVGKDLSIGSLALIDTGAKSCVMHEKLAKAMGLEPIGKETFRGFGGSRAFQSELVEGRIELAGKTHAVSFASIGDARFPLVAPSIVLGRNLPRLFKVTLDGPNRKITIEPGR